MMPDNSWHRKKKNDLIMEANDTERNNIAVQIMYKTIFI